MRVYNFGAGPATLPLEVLEQAQQEGLEWQQQGMSVMEVSHRSAAFMALLAETTQLCRELLAVPAQYQVLWMGAPARFHFGAVALNFLKTQADYVVSGSWSRLAHQDALKVGLAQVAASNEAQQYLALPQSYQFNDKADYCYFTPNETLSGLKLSQLTNRPTSVPLIADMTSCILSEEINIADYAMIIAGAQKNLAPSGLSLVIIADELLAQANANLPSFFNYQVHADNQSNYATPPTYNIYMANLMLKWLQKQGGVKGIEEVNRLKAERLYQCIDNSSLYHCPIAKDSRSMMNVAFRLKDENLNARFLEQAAQQGLMALKGHRSVGGMRASIYNAMPLEGVMALINFMQNFEHNV